jgi:hypothetical protein
MSQARREVCKDAWAEFGNIVSLLFGRDATRELSLK